MSASDVAADLSLRMESLAIALHGFAPTSRERTATRFGSRGSLCVEIAGAKRGCWYDHEAGIGGDALDLVRHLRGGTMAEALSWARGWLGNPSAPAPKLQRRSVAPAESAEDGRAKQERARRIWIDSAPIAGTLAASYLENRGLVAPDCEALRFHSACPCGSNGRLPAMVALMTDPETGEPCGVHRTFLAADGRGKAAIASPKMMLGQAGVICLSAAEGVTSGLGITEGIENGLAILQAAGWSPIWAAGSAGNIAKFPVLRGIEALTIFADVDDRGAGLKAARECLQRWQSAGREVVIEMPPTGLDWNDVVRGIAA